MRQPPQIKLIVLIIIVILAVYTAYNANTPGKYSEAPIAENSEAGFCLRGCPTIPPHDTEIIHHILELSNNPTTKFADWVAYRITKDTLGSGCKRTWMTDPELDPNTTLEPSDYRDIRKALTSDRGHQAPLASLCGSPYWQEADYLSNITPQKSELNEGTWEHLEAAERNLIKEGATSTVYSITGPLFERDMPKLPNAHEDHTVPSGYWKIVSINDGPHIEVASFIMDQDTPRDTDFCQLRIAVGDIEKRANLEFFPLLPATERTKVEQQNSESLLRALGC